MYATKSQDDNTLQQINEPVAIKVTHMKDMYSKKLIPSLTFVQP